MAKQTLPDGREVEYNENDPADVMRVAIMCEPSDQDKRDRAKAAFEAAAPEAAREAALAHSAPLSSVDVNEMIKAAIKAALAASKAEATTPVDGSQTPVEGSQN